MKKTLLLNLMIFCVLNSGAQLMVSDFETFTLSPNSFYMDTTSTPFSTQNASFQHRYSKFGPTWYWTGGFAYTNVNDSANGSFLNLHGVKAFKGYNASSNYAVGQDRSMLHLLTRDTVHGFYLTNTTYAYKMILFGDTANAISRKFGDTTGTGSGTTIAQGAYPDYFKLTVKGFKNGLLSSDSVEFYLADYRFQNNVLDYVLDTWQWVNTSALGEVDSLKFWMYSSDVGQFGINTPLFFAIDNFTTKGVITGVKESKRADALKVYPLPFHNQLTVSFGNVISSDTELHITDLQGTQVFSSEINGSATTFDLSGLPAGLYVLEISNGQNNKRIKILKD